MVTVSRPARCSSDAVLDVLSDGWSYATWVVGTARIRAVDPGWPAGEARVRITVVPGAASGGCTVRISEDADKGPGRLVPRPVRSAVIGPRNVETLRRLVHLAERSVP